MEKKQLNFSAPLLSARRYSSPLRPSCEEDKRWDSPPRKSIASEVVKPGSVPFIWEQIPGKAKTPTESVVQSPEQFPGIPKLPPAFLSWKSAELSGFRTPNKLSGELGVLKPPRHKFSGELYTLSRPHKFSGELNTFQSCQNKLSSNDPTYTKDINMNPSSESEDEDARTFSDALDTFSQFESSSFNCSITGLSGVHYPEPKHAASPTMERKVPNFMMDRFLPAAKAMTLEPSQYAARKQLVAIEQNKQVKMIVPKPNGNECKIVQYMGQDIGSEQSENDDQLSAISVKVKACRFLPWFCSKSSIRLLNPLPCMKNGSRSVLYSATKVGKLVKNRSWRSATPKSNKDIPCSNNTQKVGPTFKSCELQKPPKLIPRPMFYSGELQTTRSTSPYRNSSRRNSPSVSRNESPHTLHHNRLGFLAVPKRVNPCDENRMSYGSKSGRLDIMRARGMSGPLPQRSNFSKIGENVNRNICRELVAVGDEQGGARSPFTPPLPKSPSDSWLSRNMGSVSPRNSVSYSSMNSKVKSRKQNGNGVPATGAKWEMIVKSSYLHHDHGRFSEELVTHVLQRPQTWK